MIKVNHGPLQLFQFENLNNFPGIRHAVTTRHGGISEGYADSLNLGLGVDDRLSYVEENRRRLAEYMGVPLEKLIFQKQTHSTNYKIITSKNYKDFHDNNDALITAEKGIAIASLGADCVPVLLYDPVNEVIAAVHSGWKGTVNGITRIVVDAMRTEFNTKPQDIIAGIGPSICSSNYEVGPEVVEAFEKSFPKSPELISNRNGDKAHVDLWKANETWLMNEGVQKSNIEISGLCTYDHPELFFSARYFKNKTGRFGACIVLK